MGNPLRSWKFLPWRSLLQASAITVLIAKVVDGALGWAVINSEAVANLLQTIFSNPLSQLLLILLYFGVGVLAVYLLETLFPPGPIYASTLWALMLCLVMTFVVAGLIFMFLPVPALLISLDQNLLIGLVVGVFWQGRHYWRW
jgi:hypothetical protein